MTFTLFGGLSGLGADQRAYMAWCTAALIASIVHAYSIQRTIRRGFPKDKLGRHAILLQSAIILYGFVAFFVTLFWAYANQAWINIIVTLAPSIMAFKIGTQPFTVVSGLSFAFVSVCMIAAIGFYRSAAAAIVLSFIIMALPYL